MTLFDLTVGDMMNESILGRAQEPCPRQKPV